MEFPSAWSTPPETISLAENEIDIWRVALDREPAEVRELEETLSPDEKTRAARFHFARDRDRFIAGRGTLRKLLAAYLKTGPKELNFRYGHRGKPILDMNAAPPVSFNVSHADGVGLFAFASKHEIGIDLERIREDLDVEGLAKRYFSSSELEELHTLPQNLRTKAFFLGWTRKEAYIKARGEGLYIRLSSFDVTLSPGQQPSFTRGVESIWKIESLCVAEGCPAAVVYEGPSCGLRLYG